MAIQVVQKKGLLDTIGQVVGIGQGVLGAVNTVSGLKDKADESKAASDEKKRKAEGIFTQEEFAKTYSPEKFQDAASDDVGATSVKVQDGDNVNIRRIKALTTTGKMEPLSFKDQTGVQDRMVKAGTPGALTVPAYKPDGTVGMITLKPPREKEDPSITLANKLGSAPGFEVEEGARPTKEDADKVKTTYQAYLASKGTINRLREIAKTSGTESFGRYADEIARLRTDLQLQYKNVSGLGQISSGDQAMLDALIPDGTNSWQKLETLNSGYNQFETILKSQVAAAAQARGFKFAALKQKNPGDDQKKPSDVPQYTLNGAKLSKKEMMLAAQKELEKLGVAWNSSQPNGNL